MKDGFKLPWVVLFEKEPFCYKTEKTIDDCGDIIKCNCSWFFKNVKISNGSYICHGSIKKDRFSLFFGKWFYGNSFGLIGFGSLEEDLKHCTLIKGYFRVRRDVQIFMVLYFGFLLFGMVSVFFKQVRQHYWNFPELQIPLYMMLFGFALIYVGCNL